MWYFAKESPQDVENWRSYDRLKLNLQELTFGRNVLNRLANLILLRILKHLDAHVNQWWWNLDCALGNFGRSLRPLIEQGVEINTRSSEDPRDRSYHTWNNCDQNKPEQSFRSRVLMNQSSRINNQWYFWLEELKTLIEAQRLMSLI